MIHFFMVFLTEFYINKYQPSFLSKFIHLLLSSMHSQVLKLPTNSGKCIKYHKNQLSRQLSENKLGCTSQEKKRKVEELQNWCINVYQDENQARMKFDGVGQQNCLYDSVIHTISPSFFHIIFFTVTLMLVQSIKKIDQKLEQSEIDDEIIQNTHQIHIKNLETKFFPYVNELNSSVLPEKNKIQENFGQPSQKQSTYNFELGVSSILDSISIISIMDCQKTKKEKRKRSSSIYRIIEGELMSGKAHGKTRLQFNNGCLFNGTAQYGQIKQGSLTYPNGAVYIGGFSNSLPNGPGKLIFPNGTQYRTVFKNGETASTALIIYANEDIYKGPIFRLKKHGIGKLLLKNGNKYIGDFKFGEITGEGTYYINQRPVASGIWKNGELITKGYLYPRPMAPGYTETAQ